MSLQNIQSKGQVMASLKPEDRLKSIKDLSKIFPDIEGELCSRHSTLLGKLKYTFNKLYDNMQPSHYIIVKGNTHIIGSQQDQVELSMGLENGIIILVAKTYEKNNIFLNGNHIDEELIFDFNGKLLEGLNQHSQEMQKIFKAAVFDPKLKKVPFGGIIYVHANIPEGFYNYKKSLLTALFLSMLTINDRLADYTITQIIKRLSQTKEVDQIFLEKQFYDYENREFCLMVGPVMYKVPLESRLKLLFCRLDLAHCDIQYSQHNIKQLQQGKQKIISLLKQKYGINSFYEAFQNKIKMDLSAAEMGEISGLGGKKQDQITRLIDAEFKQLSTICELSNKRMSVQDLIKIKWLIDSQLRCIFTEEVVDLVEEIKAKIKIQACTLIEDQYLMLAVDKSKYSELICILRQLLHKGELKSKSCFKLDEQLIQTRWGEDNGIGQKIFVSVPSKGISIFNPSQAIWFD